MTRILSVLALGAVTSFSAAASAQPRASRRPLPPATAPSAAPPADASATMCMSRRAVIGNEQNKLEDQRAALAGVSAEIDALKRRIDELERQRVDLIGTVARSEVRLETKLAGYRTECEQSESCEQYEKMAADLESSTNPVEQALEGVKNEIAAGAREVGVLRGRIEPLRKEYASLKCNNMVPGETAQTTIDRCTAIFSEWNRLQADLNQQNNRLPILRSRYEQLAAQLKSTEQRAKGYEEYLTRNCKASQKIQVVRRYQGVHDRARALAHELDALAEQVTSLRGVRISVTAE